MNIDIWSDVACPWCYIGKRRFETALAAFPHRDEITVAWHSYQLDPTLPEHDDRSEAEYLAASKGMPIDQVRQMFGHVAEQAAAEGLDYDFDSLVVANSLRAHQLIQLAKEHGGETTDTVDTVEEALFRAHFVDGEDIGASDVLVRIGVAAGLDADVVTAELQDGTRIPAVQEDVRHAASLGLNSVPTFVLDMKLAVPGAQPVEVFTRALEQQWAASHPAPTIATVPGVQDEASCGPDGCQL
ncbi:MAG: DsbA family oxidoreductase [Corynebacterium sp.]|uniref:DsbA family oxidoreductase n=1 Tax=unclassified Corynebacterium TaxID=2624378 RepID=UPI0026474E1E|nr:DsbA family oxidoreductase [Corynebacterium sp.]MDN5719343.1 DsbA family oxidoreductase [Corynebacterium sp.]MDN6510703.1 DsbA family oxidoreductase [Corynebacterium sp.]